MPDIPEPRGFRSRSSKVTASVGSPRHRGRDLFIREGADAWVLGKFAYGKLDDDLEHEEVDVYLNRGCGEAWERVGTFTTTDDNEHATVHGVTDTGGRIYVNLRDTGVAPLRAGRHRIRMVVGGDASQVEQFIVVLESDARVVVTDIDGTLTSSEWAAVSDVIGLDPAGAHPGSAELMSQFVEQGYHVFYLTARPEWMMALTRQWLALRGFPFGVLHTTLSKSGALGTEAALYKAQELAWLREHTGLLPAFGFGNKSSDVRAYESAGIPPSRCFYFGLKDDAGGGTVHTDYTSLFGLPGRS